MTELEAEVTPWLAECGSCDAGLPMACTCPKGDFRPVLLKLWRAYEAAAALPHLRVQETRRADSGLHEAVEAGIKRALRDFGADLTGCTPSALTGHIINEIKAVDHG